MVGEGFYTPSALGHPTHHTPSLVSEEHYLTSPPSLSEIRPVSPIGSVETPTSTVPPVGVMEPRPSLTTLQDPHDGPTASMARQVETGTVAPSVATKPEGAEVPISRVVSRHRKEAKHIPFRQPVNGNDAEEWHHPGGEANEWMSIFYDLIVVAVLSVFSGAHEINTPEVIVLFLTYYILIIWVWTSQVHYDVRYEGDDVFHRICKAIQVAVFGYIGAASGGWNLDKLLKSGYLPFNTPTSEVTAHQLASTSFLAVGVAFILSRVCLLLQYLYVIVDGRKARRTVSGPILHVVTLAVSIVLITIATGLPATVEWRASVKIGFFFAAIGQEMVFAFCQAYFVHPTWSAHAAIAERYGALTLIILGEGFVALVQAFNNGLTSLHATGPQIYGQAFFIVFIIVNIWIFLFSNFHKEDYISPRLTAWWEVIHFPLHFCMLLLLAAMVNSIVVWDMIGGYDNAQNYYGISLKLIQENKTLAQYAMEDPLQAKELKTFMYRIKLDPSFEASFELLSMAYHGDDTVVDNSTYFHDFEVESTLYSAYLIKACAVSAGAEVPHHVESMLDSLHFVETAVPKDTDPQAIEKLRHTVAEAVKEIGEEIIGHALTGVLWLYESAGAVLILAAGRSMIKYRFAGRAHHAVHAAQIVGGVALAFFGLFSLPSKTPLVIGRFEVKSTLIYRMVLNGLVVVPVLVTYTTVNLICAFAVWVHDVRLRDRRGSYHSIS